MEIEREWTRDQLIAKNAELEALVTAMNQDPDDTRFWNKSWAGNLGRWYWYLQTDRLVCSPRKFAALGFDIASMDDAVTFAFFTARIHPDDLEPVNTRMQGLLRSETGVFEAEYRLQARDGSWHWHHNRAFVSVRAADGSPQVLTGIVFDITAQKQALLACSEQQSRMARLSSLDGLTGLLNRQAMYGRLNQAMIQARQAGQALTILVLDIDRFERINRLHGSGTGDLVLAQIAAILQRCTRHYDFISRLGGDQFLIGLANCDFEQGQQVAERIRGEIACAHFPKALPLTISGGLAAYEQQTIDEIISQAEARLAVAKQNGCNQICQNDRLRSDLAPWRNTGEKNA